mmetsp:Transcript_35327/g.80711  ORF Transcript_35327/g.80711 Transcript_35327/m.80711 type:complete len:304 (+) Transcript_35327:1056-1967(+)
MGSALRPSIHERSETVEVLGSILRTSYSIRMGKTSLWPREVFGLPWEGIRNDVVPILLIRTTCCNALWQHASSGLWCCSCLAPRCTRRTPLRRLAATTDLLTSVSTSMSQLLKHPQNLWTLLLCVSKCSRQSSPAGGPYTSGARRATTRLRPGEAARGWSCPNQKHSPARLLLAPLLSLTRFRSITRRLRRYKSRSLRRPAHNALRLLCTARRCWRKMCWQPSGVTRTLTTTCTSVPFALLLAAILSTTPCPVSNLMERLCRCCSSTARWPTSALLTSPLALKGPSTSTSRFCSWGRTQRPSL